MPDPGPTPEQILAQRTADYNSLSGPIPSMTYTPNTQMMAQQNVYGHPSWRQGYGVQTALTAVHGLLDVGGFFPVVGSFTEAINAVIYAAQGNKVGAVTSIAGMVPVIGDGALVAKYGYKGIKAAEETNKIIVETSNASKLAKDSNKFRFGGKGYLQTFSSKGTDNVEQLGGAYKNVPANGGQVHHMPADSVSPFSKGDGPAVRMETKDHMKTKSWGSSKKAKEYRAKQKGLIEQGKFKEAQQMDINDLRSQFGNKYDKGIEQMQNYTNDLLGD